MQINVDPTSLNAFLAGKKFYLGALAGMAAIAANHYGALPFAIPNDPNAWVNDEYTLLMSMFVRSGVVTSVAKIAEQSQVDPRLSKIVAEIQKRPDDKPV